MPASRLLLRVRVRKGTSTVTSTEVVGAISSTFRFGAIADFQYLTVQSFTPSGEAMSSTRVSDK